MSPARIARTFIGQIFLFMIFFFSLLNGVEEREKLWQRISDIDVPESVQEISAATLSLFRILDSNYIYMQEMWRTHSLIHAKLGSMTMRNFSIIKMPEDRLYRGSFFPVNDRLARVLGESIAQLNTSAMERGIDLFYLGVPDLVLKGMPPLPQELPIADFNSAVDALLFTLRENNVPFLDARYSLIESGFPLDKVSMKTDTQLTARAAFQIYARLVKELEKTFGLALDPDSFYTDPANYLFTQHEKFFIGQFGKESGPDFSGLDDFVSVTPIFASHYQMECIDMFENFAKFSGDAEESFLAPAHLSSPGDLYNFYPQGFYRHSSYAWSVIKNSRQRNGLKLLFIHDAYTAQIVGHLAPLFQETHTLARQDNFSLAAEQYIKNNPVDLVLIAFNPQTITDGALPRLLLEETEP